MISKKKCTYKKNYFNDLWGQRSFLEIICTYFNILRMFVTLDFEYNILKVNLNLIREINFKWPSMTLDIWGQKKHICSKIDRNYNSIISLDFE